MFAGTATDFEFSLSPPSVALPDGITAARLTASSGVINFTQKVSQISMFCASVDPMDIEVYPLPDAQGAILHSATVAASGSMTSFNKTSQSWTGQFAGSIRFIPGGVSSVLIDNFQFCEEEGFSRRTASRVQFHGDQLHNQR